MIKIGLMGCGVVASYGHLPVLKSSSDFELVSIFDPDRENLEKAQKSFDVPQAFDDVEEFFKSGIDAVTITSPAPVHHQNVMDAARFGKPVLCEKPLAMDANEAESMISVMEEKGLMLFTGFDYRFSPASLRIKELVEAGAIGTVRSLRLSYIWNLHGKYIFDEKGTPSLNERREGRMAEGGPLVDCGVHQIDLARWWLDSEVVRQHAEGVWVEDYAAPDHMYLHMDHASGAHTMVEISFSFTATAKEPLSHFVYHLIGTEGVIRYDREAKLFEMRNLKGTTQFPFYGEKNFAGLYQGFAQALTTGLPGNMPTGYDGLVATRIARSATEDAMGQRLKK